MTEPPQSEGTEPTPANRTLRTCLIVGAGCAGILLIGICILLAFGVPVTRRVFQSGGWEQALRDAVSGDLRSTLEASGYEPGDQNLLLDLEGTVAAALPDDLETSLPEVPPDVSFEGISFSYPEGYDYGAIGEIAPPELEVEWLSQPERIIFSLEDFPLQGTFHDPRIIVMSTQALLAVNGGLEPILNELKELLQNQVHTVERIPFIMPSFNAAQMITTQIAYLPFEGGVGVRFVTQYGQAAWPINNKDLFYAFQGLTDDDAYLVTAVLPITHPGLPVDGESLIGDDIEGFFDHYEDYLAGVKQNLDSQPPDAFNPGLSAFDEMMASLKVEIP